MDVEQLRQLVSQPRETAKVDFKIQFYKISEPKPLESAAIQKWKDTKDQQWAEIVKDILALTNGNIGTVQQTAYLIIGSDDKLKADGTPNLQDVGNQVPTRKDIYEKVNSYCEPRLPNLDCEIIGLDNQQLFVISIPPSPYVHKLSKQLKTPKKDFSPHTVLLRRGDGEETYEASDEEKKALQQEKNYFFEKQIVFQRDLDELVREVRSHAKSKIKSKHGMMKMLRVNGLVPVDEIYVDLNILEQVSRDRQFSDYRREHDPDDRQSFHRLGAGEIQQQGVPALQKVRSTKRLMVLGKPGSGKSTLLKSLAVACIEDGEKSETSWLKSFVPIFVSLKPFATDAKKQTQFNLMNYVYHQEFCSWGEKDFKVLESILDEGRALVLLDGLDEVPAMEQESVLEEVFSFCDRFHKNRFLISCRTQNRHRLENFEDVEIDDFKLDDQVPQFIRHWFRVVKQDEHAGDGLLKYLQTNQSIAELSVTPILLNLICVVFQIEEGNLPKNRAALYQKGIRDLLEGWDEAKRVRRTPVLETLTLEAIEKLLADIGTTLFEANDYFPEQETLEKLISKKLKISRAQARKVLRSLEEHSGLLVERSEGFWSFSHLTFQEYFVAKKFSESCNWANLAKHSKDKHWREVFLLLIEIVETIDEVLLEMKHFADANWSEDICLQNLLLNVFNKSNSIQTNINFSAIRAFYFDLALMGVADNEQTGHPSTCWFTIPGSDLLIILGFGFELSPIIDQQLEICWDFGFMSYDPSQPEYMGEVCNLDDLDTDINITLDINLSVCWCIAYSFAIDYVLKADNELLKISISVLNETITRSSKLAWDQEFKELLEDLRCQIPRKSKSNKYIRSWYENNGLAWAEALKEGLDKYRNIKLNIPFEKGEYTLLQQYYNSNKLLMDCLNMAQKIGNISQDFRQEIEETLLLPIAEIEKRKFNIPTHGE